MVGLDVWRRDFFWFVWCCFLGVWLFVEVNCGVMIVFYLVRWDDVIVVLRSFFFVGVGVDGNVIEVVMVVVFF